MILTGENRRFGRRSRPQMTIWCTRIVCCIPKATNTHSECELLIALPLQQWLHERSSMLRYTYIVPGTNKRKILFYDVGSHDYTSVKRRLTALYKFTTISEDLTVFIISIANGLQTCSRLHGVTLRNLHSHLRVHLSHSLSQINPVYAPTSQFVKMYLNIFLPFTPGSSKWSFSLRFPYQNPVCTSPILHTCYMSRTSHSSQTQMQ